MAAVWQGWIWQVAGPHRRERGLRGLGIDRAISDRIYISGRNYKVMYGLFMCSLTNFLIIPLSLITQDTFVIILVHSPAYSVVCFVNTYSPLNSDSSGGSSLETTAAWSLGLFISLHGFSPADYMTMYPGKRVLQIKRKWNQLAIDGHPNDCLHGVRYN